jgi:hypothetical protein
MTKSEQAKAIAKLSEGAPEDCGCVGRVKEALSKQHGDSVEMLVKWSLDLRPDAKDAKLKANFPPIEYTYRSGKKLVRKYIVHNFCPICGKKKR